LLTVLAYLLAVVAANLITAAYGIVGSVTTSFALIGATLTLRDRLHDRWLGRGLAWRLGLLILAGGAISALLNRAALPIAIASVTAFVASETTDSVVYQLLRRLPWLRRVNASNAAAATVDSLVFPTLAFGVFNPLWVVAELAAKVLGGAAWAWVIARWRGRGGLTPAEARGS
jgi:hypothetical protein